MTVLLLNVALVFKIADRAYELSIRIIQPGRRQEYGYFLALFCFNRGMVLDESTVFSGTIAVAQFYEALADRNIAC